MNYAGIRSLVEFDIFDFHYRAVAEDLAEASAAIPIIDRKKLDEAYLAIYLKYYKFIGTGRSDRARMIAFIGSVVDATANAKIIRYELDREKHAQVSIRYAHILARYANEITGLALGGTIYSLELKRRTGQEASCPLTNVELEAAAKQVRINPKAARAFRRILKLKRPRALRRLSQG